MKWQSFVTGLFTSFLLAGVASAEQGFYYPDAPYVITNTVPGKAIFGGIIARPGIGTYVNIQPFSTQSGGAFVERSSSTFSFTYQGNIVPAPNGGVIEGNVSCSTEVPSAGGKYPAGSTLSILVYKLGAGSHGHVRCHIGVTASAAAN